MMDHATPPALALLAGDPNQAADETLLAVLPSLAGDARGTVLDVLVAREQPRSLATIVAGFNRYDDDLQAMVLDRLDGLFVGVRGAASMGTYEQRASAFDLIVRAHDGRNAYLLADALRHPCGRTREHGAEALAAMTAQLLDTRQAGLTAPAVPGWHRQCQLLVDALRRALGSWEVHHQTTALRACLWMADHLEADLLAKLAEPRAKLSPAMQRLIGQTSDPRLAGFVLRALALPELRAEAVRTIARARDATFIKALVRESWQLVDPEVRRRCRWIRELHWLEAHWPRLTAARAPLPARAVQLVAATGLPPDTRRALWRDTWGQGDAALDRALVAQLIGDVNPLTTSLLMEAARHSDALVARIAQRALHRRQRQPGDEHQAGGVALPLGPPIPPVPTSTAPLWEQLWEHFEQLGDDECRQLAGRLGEHVPALLVQLRARLGGSDQQTRIRALRFAKAMHLVGELSEQVYRLVHDPEPSVRSCALTLLVELPGPATLRVLRDALNDPDPRVQANAIDTLDTLELADQVTQLPDKLVSPHQRVRANAIQALLRRELAEAGDALLDMLEHESPAHRLSALWVVERLKLRSLLARLEAATRRDPDPRVRKRARRVLKAVVGEPAATGDPR